MKMKDKDGMEAYCCVWLLQVWLGNIVEWSWFLAFEGRFPEE